MKPETFEAIVKEIDCDNRDIVYTILTSEGELTNYVRHIEDAYYCSRRENITLTEENSQLHEDLESCKKELEERDDKTAIQEAIRCDNQAYFNQICNICIDTVLKAPYEAAMSVLSAFDSLNRFHITFKTHNTEDGHRIIDFLAFRYLSFERDWTRANK